MQHSIDEGCQFTRDELARIDDEIGKQLAQIGTKIDIVISGQAQTTAVLTRMAKDMKSFLREVCAGDVSARTLDEWFQISRVQFQQTLLAGKYDAPFDAAMFASISTCARLMARASAIQRSS